MPGAFGAKLSGVTASPKSAMQQVRSSLTRIFRLFKSQWAIAGLSKILFFASNQDDIEIKKNKELMTQNQANLCVAPLAIHKATDS